MPLPIRLPCESCGEDELHSWVSCAWVCRCGHPYRPPVWRKLVDEFARRASSKGGKTPRTGASRGKKWRYASA